MASDSTTTQAECFPPYIQTEEDKIRWRKLLEKVPSEEELCSIAITPSPEWIAKKEQLKKPQ